MATEDEPRPAEGGRSDVWAAGDLYEPYVGRWSRFVAAEFLARLGVPAGARWAARSSTAVPRGQGPAPGYCVSLDEDRRAALRERLRATSPTERDGSIPLAARAWGGERHRLAPVRYRPVRMRPTSSFTEGTKLFE